MDKLELVMVGDGMMCLNIHHDYLPTFGWKINSTDFESSVVIHKHGWTLRYLYQNPNNRYVYYFVEDDSFPGVYSDLPYQYWYENEKMLATYHLVLRANKLGAFFSVLAHEIVMYAGEIVMSDMLQS